MMLTTKQAAERSGCSASLIYQWCKEGLLEHFRFGGRGKRGKIMVEATVLDEFIEACRQRAKGQLSLRNIKIG